MIVRAKPSRRDGPRLGLALEDTCLALVCPKYS